MGCNFISFTWQFSFLFLTESNKLFLPLMFLCVNDLCYNWLTPMYRHDLISFFQTFSVYLSLLNLVSLTHSQRWGLMESRGGAWWWHHRLWGGCLPFPGLRRWPNDKQQQKQPIRALICTMGKARGWSRATGGRVQYELMCDWKSKWRKAVVMEGKSVCLKEVWRIVEE